ncbi:hypothetical protein [Treponema sp. R6D11]
MRKIIDMAGKRFGRLKVIGLHNAGKTSRWNCLCDCGKTTIVNSQSLRRGFTKSCGCLSAELLTKGHRIKHGLTLKNRRLARIWYGMKDRCFNVKNSRYNRYGGRGITVCDEWKNDLLLFFTWAMNNGYADNLSIDRIDNDGNYCPENCRWVSNGEQARNKSSNRKLTVNGITRTLIEWCEITGMKFETIEGRIKRGWSPEKIINTPVNKNIWRNR